MHPGAECISMWMEAFPCMAVAMGNVKTEKLKDIIFQKNS